VVRQKRIQAWSDQCKGQIWSW